MPNNENENFNNELPKFNNENLDLPRTNEVLTTNDVPVAPVEEPKQIIEIPQAYYDQLAREEMAAREADSAAIKKQEEKLAITNENKGTLMFSIICAIITYLSLYFTINKSELFIFIIPAYIVLGTIISAIKKKKESIFPNTILVGGMIVAVLTFAMSMAQEENMDMWTYYTVAGAVVAFIGLIVSNMITKLIVDHKNVKALETIGYFGFFAIVVAVPIYLYSNYRTEFYRFVFQKQTVVEAETEEEFVMKTLKARYNLEFKCDSSKEKHSLTKDNRKVVTRLCSDEFSNTFQVNSIAYNEGSTEYVVIDTYMDTMFINNIKDSIQTELKKVTTADEVNVALYPEKNCTFIGDCIDCEEYFEIYQKENDIEKQFKVSTELNLKQYLTMNQKDFINTQKFKVIVEVKDQYDTLTVNYDEIINNILNSLNQQGYKNTYGYEITLFHKFDTSSDSLLKTVFKVKGKTNTDKQFKNPEIVDLEQN